MNILLFTHSILSFQTWMNCYSLEHNILKNIGNQTTLDPINLHWHCMDKKRKGQNIFMTFVMWFDIVNVGRRHSLTADECFSGFNVPRERSPSLYNHIHESTETQAADPLRRRLDLQTHPSDQRWSHIQSPVSGSSNQQRPPQCHTHTDEASVSVFMSALIISECSAVCPSLCHSG